MKTVETLPSDTISFVSDVHLDYQSPEYIDQFIQNLHNLAKSSDCIFLLGDIFHYWIGHRCTKRYRKVFDCFLTISSTTKLFFMPGNRDFLLMKNILSQYAVTLLHDPCVLIHGEARILLSHGDRYCTLDTSYQRLRSIIQHPVFIKIFSFIPYDVRVYLGNMIHRLGRKKQRANTNKKIYAITVNALTEDMLKHNCKASIYGHIHTLGDHFLQAPSLRHISLDAWEHQVNYARLDSSGLKLIVEPS